MPGWVPELSTAADWLSIVSFFVASYAAYAITRVRADIIGRVRLPDLIAALEGNSAELATLMRTYESNTDQYGLELAKCEAHLKVVRTKVPEARLGARRLIADVARFNRRPSLLTKNARKKEDAWNIYTKLIGLIEELRNIAEEKRIGG